MEGFEKAGNKSKRFDCCMATKQLTVMIGLDRCGSRKFSTCCSGISRVSIEVYIMTLKSLALNPHHSAPIGFGPEGSCKV